MVDKLNRTKSVNASNISRFKKSDQTSTEQAPKVSRTLINEIITELRAEDETLTVELVQHKVIVKSLMANFGFAASTEPKFKMLYDVISQQFSQDKNAQKLMQQAIERYGG